VKPFGSGSGLIYYSNVCFTRLMAAATTREIILATAETLFAKHGLAGTSLRGITADAGVNLAAVNYHFGNKESLIQAVFRRRLDALNTERLGRLERVEARASHGKPDLRAALEAFIVPALEMSHHPEHGGVVFMRLLARVMSERDRTLRAFLADRYGHVIKRFADVLGRALPELSDEDLFWRLNFVVGALTYSMAEVVWEHDDSAEQLAELATRLVDFAEAGLTSIAPAKNRIQAGDVA
jgi:AcrR family transcriptional regulator